MIGDPVIRVAAPGCRVRRWRGQHGWRYGLVIAHATPVPDQMSISVRWESGGNLGPAEWVWAGSVEVAP